MNMIVIIIIVIYYSHSIAPCGRNYSAL